MENRTSQGRRTDRPQSDDSILMADRMHQYFPKHTVDEVMDALRDCKQELGDALDRNRLLECMQTRLLVQAADGVD